MITGGRGTRKVMRVVAVTTFFPNSADRQRAVFVKNLVRAMCSRCAVSVVSPVPYAPPLRFLPRLRARSRIGDEEDVDGIRVLHPRFLVIPKVNWLSGFSYFVGVLPLLHRLVREQRPDLIHVHCAYPDGVGGALAARALGLPYVVTVHGSDINVYATHHSLRSQIRWALRGATGVIAVSRNLEGKVRCLLHGAATPVSFIPCAGFDTGMFFLRQKAELRAALGLGQHTRIVVFVGELVPVKGVDLLVEAWARLQRGRAVGSDNRLVIIGDGRCRADLERCVAAAGIGENVQFIGAVPQAEVSRWIAASNLLCLPSHNEGTPNVIVEALASGVPVVATRVGGVPELVSEGINGLLVPPGQIGALVDDLAQGLSRTWDVQTIRQSVAHLTWANIAAKNCEFMDSVVGETRRVSLA